MPTSFMVDPYRFGVAEASPADIDDLVSWWDARTDDFLTFSSGAEVGTWADRHGSNDAIQATASKQGDWVSDAFGTGIGGINFDGGDDVYPAVVTTAAAQTTFGIVIPDIIDSTVRNCFGTGCTVNNDNGCMLRIDNGRVRGAIGDGASRDFADFLASAGNIYRWIHRHDDTRNNIHVNDTDGDQNTHSRGSLGTEEWAIGGPTPTAAGNLFNGTICMLGVYSRYISDAERDELMDVLLEMVP